MFKNVIVRTPSRSLVNGITAHPDLGKPDYAKALEQHRHYVETLGKCGVEIHILDAMEEFPDSCFVEDTAVCTPGFAMITSPGAESRKGEEKHIIGELEKFYDDLQYVKAPGTLEGGDVMMVGDRYYIGLSDRTNRDGAEQFTAALESHGYKGIIVEQSDLLHLKTGMSYIGDNKLLIAESFADLPGFESFDKIIIPSEEDYAANCIRVNDFVIMPAGYSKSKSKIENAGFSVLEVDSSEYKKIDGGLSCLSLRF